MAEKRLIDAMQTVIKMSGRITPLIQMGANPTQVYNEVLQVVAEAPTVDAVEVVRCRDCAKNGLFTCPICFIENKTLQFVNHSPDFYCGEGERKTDG